MIINSNSTLLLCLPFPFISIRTSPSIPRETPLEESSLKRFKGEDDETSTSSSPATISAPEPHPLVPSLDGARADHAPDHSKSDQTIDSDMSVPNSLPNEPSTNVLSGPRAPAPAPAALNREQRPDDIDVPKVSSVRVRECYVINPFVNKAPPPSRQLSVRVCVCANRALLSSFSLSTLWTWTTS
jgi:hypothetical protein